MRVFVTGATGFIGSMVVRELIAAGHSVLGMTRSEAGASNLRSIGVTPLIGTIEDDELLKRAAESADGVIHLAFNHDFTRYVQNCEDDRRVIATLGNALVGSERPLIVTSGVGGLPSTPEHLPTEDDIPPSVADFPRAASEEAAKAAMARGINTSIVRLPQVHDTARQGLITFAIAMAVEKGIFAYVDEGQQRWAATHISDVANLFRLAVEAATPDAVYHAVAEEGITMKAIAETIGKRLDLPVESIPATKAKAHFDWLTHFVQLDLMASSQKTRHELGWQPVGPSLLEDLAQLTT